jgi:hypothetical protein
VATAAGLDVVPASALFPVFGRLSLPELMRMITNLDPPPGEISGKKQWLSQRDPELTFLNAASILADWPKGFHRHLHQIRNTDASQSRSSLVHEFPGLMRKLLKPGRLPESARVLLLPKALAYLGDHWTGNFLTPHRVTLGEVQPPPAKWISMTSAAARLRTASPTVAKLVREGTLQGSWRNSGMCQNLWVMERDVARLEKDWGSGSDRESLRSTLSTKLATARAIGVCYSQVDVLIESGFLKEKVLYTRKYCTNDSIVNLIAIFEDAAKQDPSNAKRLISFRGMRQGPRRVDIVRLIHASIDGELVPAWIDRSRSGLGRFFFDADEVDSFIGSDDVSGECNLREARCLIPGSYGGDVRRLLAAGLLEATRLRSAPHGAHRISLRSVETFNRNCISSAAIASRYHLTSCRIDDRLREAGLSPVLARDGEFTHSYWPLDRVDAVLNVTKRAKPFAGKGRNPVKVRRKR